MNPSQIHWIDAARKLPDDELVVLVALSDGEVWTGFHDAGEWRYASADPVDQGEGTIVTHWAEFPAPPEQEKTNRDERHLPEDKR